MYHYWPWQVSGVNIYQIIAEATAIAYKGSSNDIQQKLRRVVEVWRQRSIFELPIQEAVEARVDGRSPCVVLFIHPAYSAVEIDKSRSTGKKPLLGGSLFSSSSGSTPSELQPLVPLQVAVSKATVASTASATAANAEYDKMHHPSTPLPTPPVHAARLSQLLKALANAESSVSEVIKSRIALIEGLEKLLETNRSALSKEQSIVAQLTERKSETEATKREVEDGIMRGLSAENSPAVNHGDAGPEGEPISRPEVEALTPPPVEAITPVGSPKQAAQESDFSAVPPQPQILGGFTLPGFGNPADSSLSAAGFPPVGLGEHQTDGSNGLHAKRRKVTHEEEDYAQFAGGDLDADVAELLKQEGDAQQ